MKMPDIIEYLEEEGFKIDGVTLLRMFEYIQAVAKEAKKLRPNTHYEYIDKQKKGKVPDSVIESELIFTAFLWVSLKRLNKSERMSLIPLLSKDEL